MDIAYDHIVEETYSGDRSATPTPSTVTTSDTGRLDTSSSQPKPNLNTELQETFRAFSNSPWGAKLGGFWGTVRKQGESYYEGAKREVEDVSLEARKGLVELRGKVEGWVEGEKTAASQAQANAEEGEGDGKMAEEGKPRTESEVLRENEGLIARFRTEATRRLKDIERAEDAADEALLRFGTNIRNFLRDAVSVAPPEESSAGKSEVLFESKDATGKRLLHTTRLDAQLHVIHTTLGSFTKDPESEKWEEFQKEFQVDEKTKQISDYLEKYPELRAAMEELVPEKVEYKDFWARYHFLRLVLKTEEQKRKDMLKGASSQAAADDEIGWDEDSDEENTSSTPQGNGTGLKTSPQVCASTATLQQDSSISASGNLKSEGRTSQDRQSQPDSDASYDLVSGATSRTPGSPKEEKEKDKKNDESEEEDWE